MAIDFTLNPRQRELQKDSRNFANDVLVGVRAISEKLPTAEERFLATRPAYEAMIAAGFLRKCIPAPAGGDNAGLVDLAIMAEELYSVNASVTLTMLGTVLGLFPILIAGTPEQCGRLLEPFLKRSGAPLAGLIASSTCRPDLCRSNWPMSSVAIAGSPSTDRITSPAFMATSGCANGEARSGSSGSCR